MGTRRAGDARVHRHDYLAGMQQRVVGHSGLKVSELGLGTMTWGRDTDEHEAREQLIGYVEAGGTLLDTSASYGDGAAEEVLGQLLSEAVARDEVVLATKAGISWPRGVRRVDTGRGALLGALEGSLRRLRTDHVDLWQVHVWSDETPLEETLGALEHAVRAGKARYVGISNYGAWQTARAATLQQMLPGAAPIVSTQVQYSLLTREIEYDVVPAARALGLGVLAWSPLAGGVLTGKYRHGTPADSRGGRTEWSGAIESYLDDRARRIVEAVCRAAEGLGWTPAQVALAWVRDRPGVAAPVLGARTAAQLSSLLGVTELTLPPELVAALDDVSAD